MLITVMIIIGLVVGLIIGAVIGFFMARSTGKMARLQAEASNARKELREYHGKLKGHMHKSDDLIHDISDAMLKLQEHHYAVTKELEYRNRNYQLSAGEKGRITHEKPSLDNNKEATKEKSTEAPKDYVVTKEHA
ncbi:YhcB family protein [Thiotrichales bacterium 19S3-7]|nr:YhcB family protein [Thiotrichales bacterium 19S3-7]MCF6801709.1 YhcB family protein [Thiotrichales bacterium 19S3-11]